MMNISDITPPQGLTLKQTRDWMRGIGGYIHDDKKGPTEKSIVELIPGRLKTELFKQGVKPEKIAPVLKKWILEHELLEHNGYKWAQTVKGRGFLMVSMNPRKKLEAAWDEVAKCFARIAWANISDPKNSPYKVSDIFLFGSMTDPTKKDYGDADLIVLCKRTGEYDPEILVSEGILRRCVRGGQDFVSMSDADDQFADFEKMGRSATVVSFLNSLTDEDKNLEKNAPLKRALEKGETFTKEVYENFSKAGERLGLPNLLSILKGQEPTPDEIKILANVAVKPLAQKTMKRMLGAAAEASENVHYKDERHNNPKPLSCPPDDAERAFKWALGHPEGVEAVMQAYQDDYKAASIAAGVLYRYLNKINKQDLADGIKKEHEKSLSRVDKERQWFFEEQFEGNLTHRPDLTSINSYRAPYSIMLAACNNDWSHAKKWSDQNKKEKPWTNDRNETQPWTCLVKIISAWENDPSRQKENIDNYLMAGFSFEGKNRDGTVISDYIASFPQVKTAFEPYLEMAPEKMSSASLMRKKSSPKRNEKADIVAPTI